MGGGCCVGNCGFCCVGDCGFCCVFKCSDCGDCCVGNCGDCSDCGGKTSGTPQEDPATKHASIVANELAEMRKKATEESKKDEADCLKDIDENIEYFVQLLEEVNKKEIGGRSLNINIDKIREINEKLHNEIVGFIGRQLDNRLVKNDKELSVILEERDNAKRKKNFSDFYQRVRKEALRSIIDKIETAVREQSDSIELEIKNRLREVDNNMREEMAAFDELQRIKDQENSQLAAKQIEYMYHIHLCEIMFENLKTA